MRHTSGGTKGRTGRIRWGAAVAALGLALAPGEWEGSPASPAGVAVGVRALAAQEVGTVGALFEDLELSEEQRGAVDEVLFRHLEGEREPLAVLRAAVEVRDILSEEQTRTLLEAGRESPGDREGRPGPRRGHRGGFHGRGGPGPHGGPHAGGFADLALSDEQREAIREIRESHREELRALREDRRSGESDAEIRERTRALSDAMHEEIEAVLTDEQRARLEELREERRTRMEERRAEWRERRDEAGERARPSREEREAMARERAEILGLTDDQAEALRSLREHGEGRRGGPGRRGPRHEAMARILTPEQRDAVALARLFGRALAAGT